MRSLDPWPATMWTPAPQRLHRCEDADEAPAFGPGRGGRGPATRYPRPSSATTRSCAHDEEPREGRRAAAIPARQAESAARVASARADRRARAGRAVAARAVLETLLEAEVFAHDASGARMPIRHAAFPALK